MGVEGEVYDLTWVVEGVASHLGQVVVLEVWQGEDVDCCLALVRLFHGV